MGDRRPPVITEDGAENSGDMDGEISDLKPPTPAPRTPANGYAAGSSRRGSCRSLGVNMSPGLEFYQVRLSAPCRIVWLYLLQNNIPHVPIDAELESGKVAPQFIKNHPHKDVPLLVDGEVTAFEADAILRYLGMQYTSYAGFGMTVPERMMVESLLSWANSELHRVTGYMYAYPHVLDRYRLPNEAANETMIQAGLKEISRHLEKLDSGYLADSKFLTGDRLTIADSFVATVLLQAEWGGFKFDLWPNVCKWLKRVKKQEYWTKVHAYHSRLVHELENAPYV